MVRDLTHASGSTVTVRGQVACAWSRTERTVRVEVTVPFGSAAEVAIPKLGIRNVKVSEGGKTIWAKDLYAAGAAGVSGAIDKDGAIRIMTGGGRYVFVLEGD
jgi:alpha-L-rhamnosidase